MLFRSSEGGKNYLCMQTAKGAGKRKLAEQPILELQGVSSNGRWTLVTQKNDQDQEHPYHTLAYPNAGGEPVVICRTICFGGWSEDGKYMELQLSSSTGYQSWLLPVRKETALPELPHNGLAQEVEANDLEKGIALDHMTDSVLRTNRYSYTRVNVRRNIFRVPIS